MDTTCTYLESSLDHMFFNVLEEVCSDQLPTEHAEKLMSAKAHVKCRVASRGVMHP